MGASSMIKRSQKAKLTIKLFAGVRTVEDLKVEEWINAQNHEDEDKN